MWRVVLTLSSSAGLKGAPRTACRVSRQMLRSWLDSWSGVGHVLDAMKAAGHHVELRQSVIGWRAEFYREAACVRVDLHHHTEGLDSEQLLPQAFEIRSQLCYLHVLVPVVRERESVTVLPIDRPA